jgi:hypothetical protein
MRNNDVKTFLTQIPHLQNDSTCTQWQHTRTCFESLLRNYSGNVSQQSANKHYTCLMTPGSHASQPSALKRVRHIGNPSIYVQVYLQLINACEWGGRHTCQSSAIVISDISKLKNSTIRRITQSNYKSYGLRKHVPRQRIELSNRRTAGSDVFYAVSVVTNKGKWAISSSQDPMPGGITGLPCSWGK